MGRQAQAQPVSAEKAIDEALKKVDVYFQRPEAKINWNHKNIRNLYEALKKAGKTKLPNAEEWYKSVFGHDKLMGKDEFKKGWEKWAKDNLKAPAPTPEKKKEEPVKAEKPTVVPAKKETELARAAREAAAGVIKAVPKPAPAQPKVVKLDFEEKEEPPSPAKPPVPVAKPSPPVVIPTTWYNLSDFTPPKIAIYERGTAARLQVITLTAGEMTIDAVNKSSLDNDMKKKLIAKLNEKIRQAKRPDPKKAAGMKDIGTNYYDMFRLANAIAISVDARREIEAYKSSKPNEYKTVKGQIDISIRDYILNKRSENLTYACVYPLYYLRDIIPSNSNFEKFVTPRIARWKFKMASTAAVFLKYGKNLEDLKPADYVSTLNGLITAAKKEFDASGLRSARPDLTAVVDGMIREGERLASSTVPADQASIPHFIRRLNASVMHAISLHELKLTLDNRASVSPNTVTENSTAFKDAKKAYEISLWFFKTEFGNPKQKQITDPEAGGDMALLFMHTVSSPVVMQFENAYTDYMAKRYIEESKGVSAADAKMREQDYDNFEAAMMVAFTHYRNNENAFRSWETIFSNNVQRTSALGMIEELYALGRNFAPFHWTAADTSLTNDRKGGVLQFYLKKDENGKNYWEAENDRSQSAGFVLATVDYSPLERAKKALLKRYSEVVLEGLNIEEEVKKIRKKYGNSPASVQKINELQEKHARQRAELERIYREAAAIGKDALKNVLGQAIAKYVPVPYDRTNPNAVAICKTNVDKLEIARKARDSPTSEVPDLLTALQMVRGSPPLPTGGAGTGARAPASRPLVIPSGSKLEFEQIRAVNRTSDQIMVIGDNLRIRLPNGSFTRIPTTTEFLYRTSVFVDLGAVGVFLLNPEYMTSNPDKISRLRAEGRPVWIGRVGDGKIGERGVVYRLVQGDSRKEFEIESVNGVLQKYFELDKGKLAENKYIPVRDAAFKAIEDQITIEKPDRFVAWARVRPGPRYHASNVFAEMYISKGPRPEDLVAEQPGPEERREEGAGPVLCPMPR